MNESITIKTTVEKEDYRKFLYIETFKKSPYTFIMIAVISLIASTLLNLVNGFSIISFILYWIFMYIAALCGVCLKVEMRNKKRIKTDKTQAFDSENILKFYDNKVDIKNQALKSTAEVEYNQFFKLIESRDYFIFYFTYNQATLVRKRDIDNLEEFKSFIREKFKNNYKVIS